MFRVKGAYEVGNKGFFCFFFLDVLEVFPFLGLGFLDEWYEYGGIDAELAVECFRVEADVAPPLLLNCAR